MSLMLETALPLEKAKKVAHAIVEHFEAYPWKQAGVENWLGQVYITPAAYYNYEGNNSDKKYLVKFGVKPGCNGSSIGKNKTSPQFQHTGGSLITHIDGEDIVVQGFWGIQHIHPYDILIYHYNPKINPYK